MLKTLTHCKYPQFSDEDVTINWNTRHERVHQHEYMIFTKIRVINLQIHLCSANFTILAPCLLSVLLDMCLNDKRILLYMTIFSNIGLIYSTIFVIRLYY